MCVAVSLHHPQRWERCVCVRVCVCVCVCAAVFVQNLEMSVSVSRFVCAAISLHQPELVDILCVQLFAWIIQN